ncbi:MAG TPA: hypothetical protein PLX89_21620 [Verrucomicrobiota bacterium]|nr:hypothetical protein [Verrucomicrobiales bacterium]HRI15603.1 hypothetical protein [Verrucomicrobiota bacterium]
MNRIHLVCLLLLVTLSNLASALSQDLPKTQPKLLTIIREEVKVGRAAEHSKHEAGWPAAYEKAKSPDYYLALVSMTGPSEVWYVVPAESYTQVAESMKREDKDPVLSAELARLALADAEYVSRVTTVNAVARPELSLGTFPDMSKVRFFEIGIYRVRPGQDLVFEEIAKAYGAARKRAAPDSSYRTYQISAGMPGPAFLVISTVEDFAAFDKSMADDLATFKGATPDEQAIFKKWGDAVTSEETQRFRLDPVQSYVPKETRAKDPEFWQPK